MRYILILIACMNAFYGFSSSSTNDKDTLQANSVIKEVTVFYQGAQVSRQANLKLSKGKQVIVFDSLTFALSPQSIAVKGLNENKILSVKHQLAYPSYLNKSSKEKELELLIKNQKIAINEIVNKIHVYELEEAVIYDNSQLKSNGNSSAITDIKNIADYYRLKLNEIKSNKLNLQFLLNESIEKMQDSYIKLNEVTSKKRTYSQVVVIVDVIKEQKATLNLEYFVSAAGWEPIYDLRVEDISTPLTIAYKANVFQSSMENWSNVRLTLSTGKPVIDQNQSELNSWILGKENSNAKKSQSETVLGDFKGVVFDKKSNLPLPNAVVEISNNDQLISQVIADQNGRFNIKPIPLDNYFVKISYPGYIKNYRNITLKKDNNSIYEFGLTAVSVIIGHNKDASAQIDTIASIPKTEKGITRQEIMQMATRDVNSITAVSSNVFAYDDYYDRMKSTEAVNREFNRKEYENATQYLNLNEMVTNVVNIEFYIEQTYSIPSDGQENMLLLKETKVPASYVHRAIPKLESDVYLNAHIINWDQLQLLNGQAQVYYQGSFVGNAFINTKNTGDTLTISLGRDKSVYVDRIAKRNLNEKKIFSNSIKDFVSWEITVRNSKNAPIKVVLEDQFPISENSLIEVERLEYKDAKVDDLSGKLTWEFDLLPSEKKVASFKYSVRYPKNAKVKSE